MKKFYYLLIITAAISISSCRTQQSRLAGDLSTEWNIDRYEVRSPDGQNMIIENAGTLELNDDGTGLQRFSGNVVNFGNDDNTAEFEWHNTRRTVYIKPKQDDTPKVWIVVNSRRSQQIWYSTDDDANVQILEISRK
jgi:hypothetical protein